MLTVTATRLPEVLLLTPGIFSDARGFFMESFNQREFSRATGVTTQFVQDNHSRSAFGVLRGLHYQLQEPQGKLVRVVQGEVFDVAVDMRRSSPRFGQWIGVRLSADNRQQLWIPPGFAHGFLVLSNGADFLYKTTSYYAPQYEYCLRWNDSTVGIEWPLDCIKGPILSPKDASGLSLADSAVFERSLTLPQETVPINDLTSEKRIHC